MNTTYRSSAGSTPKAVLAAQDGQSIHRYGPYAFAEMHIVEIAAPGTIGG